LIAGGIESSKVVDIYDTVAESWSVATLSQNREKPTSAAVGTKAYFCGGSHDPGFSQTVYASNTMDVYDSLTNTWSVMTLPTPQFWDMTAAAVGNYFFIGAGIATWRIYSSHVDILDTTTGEWSNTTLSRAGYDVVAVTVKNIVLFVGGYLRPITADIVSTPSPTSPPSTPSTPALYTSSSDSSGLSQFKIAGIIVGISIFVIILVILIGYLVKNKIFNIYQIFQVDKYQTVDVETKNVPDEVERTDMPVEMEYTDMPE